MYTDFPEFHLISPTALMMNDLHLSSYYSNIFVLHLYVLNDEPNLICMYTVSSLEVE